MSEDTVQRLMGLAEAWHKAQVTAKSASEYAARYSVEDYGASGRAIGALKAQDAARATLESALCEALMPAGWKLVPVEPTPQMVTAGMDGLGSCVGSCGEASPPDRSDIADSYRAMLSAAPSAFPVELEQPEQPLGDAADAAGLSAPALRASASIPIAMTEKLGDMRHYLRETAGFASLAPRARENINTVLELLDELAALEHAPAEKRRLDEIEHAQDRDYWRTEREHLDSIDKDDEA